MTKKMFVREKSKSDFLIAEIGKPGFKSLKTGKNHKKAMVVYTGVDLTPNHLVEKGAENRQSISLEDTEYTLNNVVNFKIGKSVTHNNSDEKPPTFDLCG